MKIKGSNYFLMVFDNDIRLALRSKAGRNVLMSVRTDQGFLRINYTLEREFYRITLIVANKLRGYSFWINEI